MSDAESNIKAHKGVGKVAGRQRVTMQDIARAAGCSQPTVSFVLNENDSAKISKATKQRVFEVAHELGYEFSPKPALRTSKGGQSGLYIDGPIAFVVDNLATSPEGVHAFDGIMQAVRQTGNIVMLAETRNDAALEERTLRQFLEQDVSAIIYACVFTRHVTLPDILRQTDTPVFLLNCWSDDLIFPSVIPSDVAGGHSATHHLLASGHTRIGTIVGEPHMECAKSRLKGYRNALSSADIPCLEELIYQGDWLPSSGYEGTRALMALPNPPTAIFCHNDRMVIGCYEALKELGLSIPKDVSVVGYDDDEVASHLSPPLTTVNLASRALGRWVIDQLFHGPRGEDARHPLVKLECELVERNSVAPPNK